MLGTVPGLSVTCRVLSQDCLRYPGILSIQGLRVYAVTCRVLSQDCLRYPGILRIQGLRCYVPGTVPGCLVLRPGIPGYLVLRVYGTVV